jgi:polyribonucleotide nucleotidyltransferase
MKKTITTALVLTMLASTAAVAQPYGGGRGQPQSDEQRSSEPRGDRGDRPPRRDRDDRPRRDRGDRDDRPRRDAAPAEAAVETAPAADEAPKQAD